MHGFRGSSLLGSLSKLLCFINQVTPVGWSEGECGGKAGWFPSAFVERRQGIPSNKVIAEVF
ncbi:hypothetical protein AMTR_s00160p00064590 [Amborella trichopoda]|uniref:SH3 domain-containing protein n=1 Tax=Amborella trichopoda TaxID=13333 RepID=W1PTF2_AMBTC|nr:hypothetical protein AMTR_s00160p00064590 [Amborella trichopoda]